MLPDGSDSKSRRESQIGSGARIGRYCAVIRVRYSTLDGTAVAYESYQYWNEWEKYPGVNDPQGMAKFFKRGIMVFKSEANQDLKKVRSNMDALGISETPTM